MVWANGAVRMAPGLQCISIRRSLSLKLLPGPLDRLVMHRATDARAAGPCHPALLAEFAPGLDEEGSRSAVDAVVLDEPEHGYWDQGGSYGDRRRSEPSRVRGHGASVDERISEQVSGAAGASDPSRLRRHVGYHRARGSSHQASGCVMGAASREGW